MSEVSRLCSCPLGTKRKLIPGIGDRSGWRLITTVVHRAARSVWFALNLECRSAVIPAALRGGPGRLLAQLRRMVGRSTFH
jgi:hypothetical protein